MRSENRDLRIAIATLYVRMRDARRREEEAFNQWGVGPLYEAAHTENLALYNAIMAIRENLQNPASMPAGQFVPLIGRMAQSRRQARERREMAAAV